MARIARFMEAERAAMFLYDQENDELWSIAATGRMDDTIRIPADKGIAGHVMSSGEVLNIADAYQDPRFNQEVDRRTGFRTHNILCVPVHNDAEKRIGVVQLLNKAGGFSERDAQLLAALTQQSAIAIENAQLSDHLQALRQSEQALQEALTQQHLDLQQAYQRISRRILNLVNRFVPAGSCAIWRFWVWWACGRVRMVRRHFTSPPACARAVLTGRRAR